MKTKKVLTANLKPGMVSSEAAYTFTNHLVIKSNTTLTEDIIEKLKYYAIKSVKVYVPDENDNKETEDKKTTAGFSLDGPTYFERVQQSEAFVAFKDSFMSVAKLFHEQLDDFAVTDNNDIVEEMLHEMDMVLSNSRNPLHLLDMMQCLRGYDDITYVHSMNVALISNVIGNWLNLSKEDLRILTTCGLLHDIGKIKIPPEIIKKPGKLTDEEFALVRSHPKLGFDILSNRSLDERVKFAALQHHERFDGSGYPRNLTGPEISKFSSIIAIADVYDAMTSNRSYRKGICPFKVIASFEKEKELYEPSLLYLFMERTIEAYVNTEVLLSNKEKAKVVLLNKNSLSRPVVITDTKTYDLSRDFNIEIEELI